MQKELFYELTEEEKISMEGGIIPDSSYLGRKLGYFIGACIAYDLQVEYISNFNDTVVSVGRTDLLKDYPAKPEW